MIKVALVIGRLNVGGAEAELVRLANRLDRSRFEPFVVAIQDRGPLAAGLRSVDVVELRRRKWSLGTAAALRRVFEERRPHVVQTLLFAENVLCRRIGFGAVISGLQGSLSDASETGPSLRLLLERWTWPRARAVVSNSRFYRDLYERLGLDASKIRVIPSGVEAPDAAGAVAAGEAARKSLGLRPEEVLVTCVARLVERKGHEDLLRAAHGFRLLFVGDGPLRPTLEGRGAILAGTRDDVPALLAASDIVALPSRFGEGCPNALLEAMAMARPVVAARAGGTPEVVEDGVTGILHAPGNVEALRAAIRRLAADAELRRSMGRAGRERALGEFGVEKSVSAYQDLYAEIAGGA